MIQHLHLRIGHRGVSPLLSADPAGGSFQFPPMALCDAVCDFPSLCREIGLFLVCHPVKNPGKMALAADKTKKSGAVRKPAPKKSGDHQRSHGAVRTGDNHAGRITISGRRGPVESLPDDDFQVTGNRCSAVGWSASPPFCGEGMRLGSFLPLSPFPG